LEVGLENLVEVTTYLVRMEDFVEYNETYSNFFSVDGPARTTVAVERLTKPDALIEMRGVAYITENTETKS
jgi:2-aminomuconate deaminase